MRNAFAWLLAPLMPLVRWAHESNEVTFRFGYCPEHGSVIFGVSDNFGYRTTHLTWADQFVALAEKAEFAESLQDDDSP